MPIDLPMAYFYFTKGEIAAWRNMAVHYFGRGKEDWVDFPGPATWWKGYDEKRFGWKPDKNVSNAYKAYHLIVDEFSDELPIGWDQLSLSLDQLYLEE